MQKNKIIDLHCQLEIYDYCPNIIKSCEETVAGVYYKRKKQALYIKRKAPAVCTAPICADSTKSTLCGRKI